jgi:hypothetical protein
MHGKREVAGWQGYLARTSWEHWRDASATRLPLNTGSGGGATRFPTTSDTFPTARHAGNRGFVEENSGL